MTLSNLGGASLTQLAYLVAVDTHRHFGRASAACNVTQPTLSMQLHKLEGALGVELFDRSRTPVIPTELGAVLIAQARVVLREAARLGDLRDQGAGLMAGELRLGVIPTLAPYLLPGAIPTLQRLYPDLELVVEERLTGDIVTLLREDRLDVGLIASAGPAELVSVPVFREPFVAYVSKGHRLFARRTIKPADLSLDDLWLLAEGHCFRAQAVQLCRQRGRRATTEGETCTAGARFESGNLETLKRLVERGVGMTLLPALAAAELPTAAQRALVRPFASPAPYRDVRLVRHREQLRQHLVRGVVDVLTSSLPAEIERL